MDTKKEKEAKIKELIKVLENLTKEIKDNINTFAKNETEDFVDVAFSISNKEQLPRMYIFSAGPSKGLDILRDGIAFASLQQKGFIGPQQKEEHLPPLNIPQHCS